MSKEKHVSSTPTTQSVEDQRITALHLAVSYTNAIAASGGATSTAATRNTAKSFADFLATGTGADGK